MHNNLKLYTKRIKIKIYGYIIKTHDHLRR